MHKVLIGVVIIIIILLGGVFLWSKHSSSQTEMHMGAMPSQTQESTQAQTNPTGSTQTTGQNAVIIQNFTFSPATLTVKVGDKVTWTNQDSVGHSATADDGSFDTGVLSQGQSGSITFSKAGTFSYHCSIHPNMKGTIVVH